MCRDKGDHSWVVIELDKAITDTEEIICPACNKPLMGTQLAPGSFQFAGCACVPPREHVIPPGSILTNLGGLWVVRRSKQNAA
jgi:ssDNA-binding Zn-finger/Zn-ribbon topoisomerase 1